MKVIVFTADWALSEEASTINRLFEKGMSCLHLRKPHWSRSQWVDLLQQIHPNYHRQIMVHQHHDLAIDFSLKGIHLKEQQRNAISDLKAYVAHYQAQGFCVSTGFHSVADLEAHQAIGFDYTFLSPVFTSISKTNYHGKPFEIQHLDQEIIALGGVTASHLEVLKTRGFSGAAILGSIWKSDDPIATFERFLIQGKTSCKSL